MQGTQTLPLAQRLPITEGLLLLVAIFWGTSYGLTKSALFYTSALMFITLRFSITALVLLPLVVRDFKAGLNKDWVVALPTGAILSAIFLCEVFGVAHTTASNAAFLISLCVLFTALAEVLVNRRKVAWSLVLLCVASVVGVLLLTGSDGARVDFTLGDYLILLAALLRALMVTTTKRFSLGRAVTTTTLTAIQSAVVAGVAAILVLNTLPQSQWHLPTESTFWVTLLYLGRVLHALCFLCTELRGAPHLSDTSCAVDGQRATFRCSVCHVVAARDVYLRAKSRRGVNFAQCDADFAAKGVWAALALALQIQPKPPRKITEDQKSASVAGAQYRE